jgi:mannose/fructose/N-acetylgalactosamine-specific phosphotransferase system component IIB
VSVRHVRIDNRLVHGQVVVTWLQAERADTIMVANDAIAGDDFQKTMLLAVKPPSVNEVILSVDEALAYLKDPAHANEQIFMLVKEPSDAIRLHRGGLEAKTMNVGNMAFAAGSKRVTRTVFVTTKDVEAFKELHDAGIELTARMMPTDRRNDFMQLLSEAKLL